MKNVTFNISASKFRCFTSAQEAKIKAGIQLFQKVVNDQHFKEKICNFVWTSEHGNRYERFLMSNGMSNMQVFDDLCNMLNKVMPSRSTDAKSMQDMTCMVMPVANKMEYEMIAKMNTVDCVCLNVSMLSKDWFTPVHVASTLMHEWCIAQGFSCTRNGVLVNDYFYTVPFACGRMMMEVAKDVYGSDPAWSKYFMEIKDTNFDYCACSSMYCCDMVMFECPNVCEQVDQVIATCETELDWLNCTANKTQDEVNRMTILANCISSMKEMKMRMFHTSLDGSEAIMMPFVERERVMVTASRS